MKDKLIQMSKMLFITVGGMAIILIVIALISPAEEPISPAPSLVPAYTKKTADKLGEDYKEAYISGCLIDETLGEYCECTYRYMDNTLTNDEFIDVIYEYSKTEEIPDVLWDAIDYCMDTL